MKTHILTIVLLMCTAGLYAQNVGIGTDTPDASAKLDVTSTNSGVLVPRIVLTDVTLAAPVTAPATGLLVWNTNAAITGGNGAGFYYWNGTQWQQIGAGDHNTLDEAYDEGGAGAGRTIDAVDGTVAINGEDGLLVTGTYASGLLIGAAGGIPEGAGTRMFFNPNKAAFRAGNVIGTQWDNTSVGNYSSAMGYNTRASNSYSTAFGFSTTASGIASTAMGSNTLASGFYSTAMGVSSTASGSRSTAMGSNTTASGARSTAMGSFTTAPSYAETVIGAYNTNYVPASTTGWNVSDRLFVVGNGTGVGAESDAIVILKNGDVGIGLNNPTVKLHVSEGVKSDHIILGNNTMTSTDFYPSNGAEVYIRESGLTGDENMLVFDKTGGVAFGMGVSDLGPPYDLSELALQIKFVGGASYNYNTSTGDNSLQNEVFMHFARDSRKRIGVWTTNPSTEFDVNGQIRMRSGSNAGYLIQGDANGVMSWADPNSLFNTDNEWHITGNAGTNPSTHFLGTTDLNDLVFRTNNTERIRLMADGDVGIGTSTPLAKLDVRGDISLNDWQLRLRDGADGNHWIGWVGGVVDGAKIVGHSGIVLNNSAYGQDVAFFQGDWAYFGFDPGQCCNGFQRVRVGKGLNGDGTLEFSNNGWGRLGGTNGLAFWYNGNADVDNNPQMLLDWAGLTLLNGRMKAGAYQFNGNCGNYLALQSDGNMVIYNSGGGPLWAAGTGCSDIRTKTNVVDLESVLPVLNTLSVIRFDYKPELNISDKPQIGVIAQEVYEHYPEIIYYDEEKDSYLVHYDKLSALLLKGVQELSEENTSLKRKNEELNSRVEQNSADIELLKVAMGQASK